MIKIRLYQLDSCRSLIIHIHCLNVRIKAMHVTTETTSAWSDQYRYYNVAYWWIVALCRWQEKLQLFPLSTRTRNMYQRDTYFVLSSSNTWTSDFHYMILMNTWNMLIAFVNIVKILRFLISLSVYKCSNLVSI